MLLRKGYKQKEVADMMGITERTVHNWRKRYEKGGVKALETKKKPGRKRKLSEEDLERLEELLKQREYWTGKEVRNLIMIEFDVKYTLRHVARILRGLGMKCQKPYVNDYRRPDDAEEILKKGWKMLE
jgi:transposase